MPHERQSIRAAVVARLLNQTAAGANVFKTRMAPVRAAQLPVISVYTLEEESEHHGSAPRELDRQLTVAIDVWAKATADVDDVLDDLTLQVETAMDGDLTLAGTAGDSALVRTEVVVSVDGENGMACAHMVYAVRYHTDKRTTPPGDDFLEVSAKWEDLDGAAPKIEADDQAEDIVVAADDAQFSFELPRE